MEETIKIINIEDEDLYIAILNKDMYEIDGQIIYVNDYREKVKIKVKDINNIRKVYENIIIEKYSNGVEYKTNEEYYDEKQKLLAKNNGESNNWENIDDEYNYKKFLQIWKPIHKHIQTFSEPLKVELEHIKYETGNEFITSMFINGSQNNVDENLYEYDRPNALIAIVSECFKKLGMKYKENINYEKTKNLKTWGNSNHSCIRYVFAFGRYIFDEKWNTNFKPKGKLNDLLNKYTEDKKNITTIIQKAYNDYFKSIDKYSFNFKELFDTLEKINNSLQKIHETNETNKDYQEACEYLNNAINQIK